MRRIKGWTEKSDAGSYFVELVTKRTRRSPPARQINKSTVQLWIHGFNKRLCSQRFNNMKAVITANNTGALYTQPIYVTSEIIR